ncbi:hypothetical protein A7K93_04930 [Candidatus Methylacidiphilum fumarolicum]|uniref:Secreted protein n=2 Tax=Candidatus Methylacidiphilum fumarolicum TaxID=591154 RepID=I0JZJ0_METFB|nr:hypothetical protein [Candidatus Methylacidiphilum fumarolicum]MBW6415440.1 hypothetical protein [Candidatus Methylacidiphilum fumarolicum]TFE69023.1 hypothetical protein A7K73_06940 [Candidatus Methylacidiphilum fumarolicum]TFE74038.1 hypothetical protein A7K93_04930 [Candidatus Methylacidiphilum fumarolicum]TFE74146.1 hypothetical protein A7D33_02080 [Candidatus Methylacidiphilum fumarolicum]TFE74935.1 hypothetical protein A7K72_02865 [Candidatus Methylacidiphilum fumarolicum]
MKKAIILSLALLVSSPLISSSGFCMVRNFSWTDGKNFIFGSQVGRNFYFREYRGLSPIPYTWGWGTEAGNNFYFYSHHPLNERYFGWDWEDEESFEDDDY